MPNNPPRLSFDLLDRYLTGQCTPEESRRVAAALAENPGLEELARLGQPSPVDVDGMWERFAQSPVYRQPRSDRSSKYSIVSLDPRSSYAQRTTVPGALRWLSGTLVALSVVALAWGVMSYRAPSSSHKTAVSGRYATTVGQRALITLSDGTEITLAPMSTIDVSAGFGNATRTVTLTGEAHFDVHGNSRAPFVVTTGSIVTQVLGTTFSVRRYPGEAVAHVEVKSGKVTVATLKRPQTAITLTSGTAGEVSDSTARIVNYDDGPQWANGQLVFRRAPVPDVLSAISRWYGYKFTADESIMGKYLTVNISTESATVALSTLSLALDVDLSYDGDMITLWPRAPSSTPYK